MSYEISIQGERKVDDPMAMINILLKNNFIVKRLT